MKTKKILLTALVIITGFMVSGQKKAIVNISEILKTGKLPQNLELNDELQTYKVTTTHYNGDIFGNFLNKQQVYGEYTRGLSGGKVKWNNVSLAMSLLPDRNAKFPEGSKINYMEDFTYEPNENMIKAEKFETFTENSAFTKNLVWDMLGIEGFAWAYWDKLKLNEPYSTSDINGKIDLAGQGFFENKDIQLTFTGITEKNGEVCAQIDYRTLNNPLEVKYEGMDMKGRSHYWGTILVSLEDKQIEHAVLYEDVILEMIFPGQTQKQIMNATREITYLKVI